MKDFFRKILVFCGVITIISVISNVSSSAPVYARELGQCSDSDSFLGMHPWDCGFNQKVDSENALMSNIIQVATNILADITAIATYLVVGYVIYGGYLYMFSSGDASKVAAGKKTLVNAFIGLAISMSAYVIFSSIRIALLGADGQLGDCAISGGSTCITADSLIVNLIQWVAGVGGVVAAIFVVIGGWSYMTSSGDPSKLEKAKKTILYALIGLVVVALAELITAFVAGIVEDANSTSAIPYNNLVTNVSTSSLDSNDIISSHYITTDINQKELS